MGIASCFSPFHDFERPETQWAPHRCLVNRFKGGYTWVTALMTCVDDEYPLEYVVCPVRRTKQSCVKSQVHKSSALSCSLGAVVQPARMQPARMQPARLQLASMQPVRIQLARMLLTRSKPCISLTLKRASAPQSDPACTPFVLQ